MKFASRVKELMATNATSTSTITLLGAVAGFRSVAKAIAAGSLTASDPGVCFVVEDNAGNWEEGLYTITGSTQLTRTSVTASSNDGAPVVFPSTSTKTVFNTVPGSFLAALLSTADGITPAQLAALSSASGTTKLLALDANNGIVTVAAGLLPGGSGGGSADTTAPSLPGSLTTSGTTQTQTTLNWAASTDNSGVAPSYEVSRNGSAWTAVAAGTLNYTFTGLTAATLYTLQVRSVDGSGNRSTAASVQVTTSAASGDTTAPNMAGSLTTASVTATGYTMNWPAGTDNVAVTGYETSTDGGTTWLDVGNVLTRAVTGATASTTYNLRARAYDAAGNRSNVLSAAVTTSAAGPTMASKYNTYNKDGNGGAAAVQYPTPGNISTNGYFDATVKLYIRTPAGVAPGAAEPVMWAWSKRDAQGNPVQPDLTTYTHNGQKQPPVRLGGWTDSDTPSTNGYYALHSVGGSGTLFIWGGAGTYDLWTFYSDGSAEPNDNGTGTPVGLVLT